MNQVCMQRREHYNNYRTYIPIINIKKLWDHVLTCVIHIIEIIYAHAHNYALMIATLLSQFWLCSHTYLVINIHFFSHCNHMSNIYELFVVDDDYDVHEWEWCNRDEAGKEEKKNGKNLKRYKIIAYTRMMNLYLLRRFI